METVYFINGFLEAGKTSLIKDLLSKEYFQIKGRTLLIVCEEGDIEFEEDELRESRTFIEYIEDEKDFNEEYIARLEKKYKPERVIVEYNGMWDRKNLEFPWFWEEIAEVAVFDATTFKLYADNMRSLLAEQVRHAGIAYFIKSDEKRESLGSFVRNIKAVNQKVNFVFRGKSGDIILDPDETLPYDIKIKELDLDDNGFAVLCLDAAERYEIYEGKTVTFTARAYRVKNGGDFEFVSGRFVLTCCEADMTFVGILCTYPKAYELGNKEWVRVKGIMKAGYDEEIKHKIPICRVTKLEKVSGPKNEIITLV
ncbi:MAG: GTPase [Eubacterium sp.]|nr:GTPase [Eubacterium sp.]